MEIFAKGHKLTKVLNNRRKIQRYFGKNRAKRIIARLDEFASAVTLRDISYAPPARCHQLEPRQACQFAVDVSRNYRIVFEGYDSHDQLSSNKDKIVTIQIIAIEDYH